VLKHHSCKPVIYDVRSDLDSRINEGLFFVWAFPFEQLSFVPPSEGSCLYEVRFATVK
jgi:hypothetical protein